jgi:hypothetical protein
MANMLKKISSILIMAVYLASCSSNGFFVLKRSANNKVFDRTGFHGEKRAPLYNKKYIKQAKKNVINSVYDDDLEDDEDIDPQMSNPAQDNIYMYKAMAKSDIENKKRNKSIRRTSEEDYPSLIDSKAYQDDMQNTRHDELNKELKQLKNLLQETRNSLANTKCPSAEALEKKYQQQQAKKNKNQNENNSNATLKNSSEKVTAL